MKVKLEIDIYTRKEPFGYAKRIASGIQEIYEEKNFLQNDDANVFLYVFENDLHKIIEINILHSPDIINEHDRLRISNYIEINWSRIYEKHRGEIVMRNLNLI